MTPNGTVSHTLPKCTFVAFRQPGFLRQRGSACWGPYKKCTLGMIAQHPFVHPRKLSPAAAIRARSAAAERAHLPQRPCSMRILLVALLLASCAAARPVQDDGDAEWGIFTALRNAQSAAEVSRESCSCWQDVLDLRSRVATLERGLAEMAGRVSWPSNAPSCPSAPDFAAASAAADIAAPALARMQLSYCAEWVRV